MNWQINFEGESTAGLISELFNINIEDVLIEGIEHGLEELENLQTYGKYCEACGAFAITFTWNAEDETPTDRGTDYRLMSYQLCAECLRDFEV